MFETIKDFSLKFVENLNEQALNELQSGSEEDISNLLSDVEEQANRVLGGDNLNPSSLCSLPFLIKNFDETLKIHSYNYFKATMLPSFSMEWRNIEWGNLIQKYKRVCIKAQRGGGKSYEVCFAFPLWRIWRYRQPSPLYPDTIDNRNSKETCLITNESRLGKIHLSKITAEIKSNTLLQEVLSGRNLGVEEIHAANDTVVYLRSKESAIRGLHVGTVIVDDFLDKSAIYSLEQRKKFSEVFYGDIMSILEPEGYQVISGTPFHHLDLYNEITKDPRFITFSYPGIYPDGRLLSPDRYTFEELMLRRKSMGSLLFSREVLVIPVSDLSTIFPYDILMRSIVGMEAVEMTSNIESFPIRMKRVAIGYDFAISANIGADSCAFMVFGEGVDDKLYLINYFEGESISHNEQISRIVSMDQAYKPNSNVVESNGFQRIMGKEAELRGLRNIKEFVTTGFNKKDPYSGLPSLAALFERGDIRIPYKEGKTREKADKLFTQFNSISFDEDKGKLESVSGHDDLCMGSFFAIQELRTNTQLYNLYYV